MATASATGSGTSQVSAAEGRPSYLELASRGQAIDDWATAKEQFLERLRETLTQWGDCDATGLSDQINSFTAPPHTVQRLAELLSEPHKWYKSSAKYMRALIRVLSVTSTTVDFSEEKEATPIAFEDSLLVPIPWLNSPSSEESERTVMPNGVVFRTTNGTIEDHGHLPVVTATMQGSAPIDATDYGPQSAEVQSEIASSAPSQDDVVTRAVNNPAHNSASNGVSLQSSLHENHQNQEDNDDEVPMEMDGES